MRADQIALQLYSVRRPAAEDLPGTLRAVADAGYEAVEVAGMPPLETAALRRLLDDHGLRPIASHEPLEAFRRDAAGVGDRLADLGCRRAIVPSLPNADHASADAVRRVAVELAGYAEQLAKRDIRLGYHNHAFEFAPLDGTTAWDVLLSELPPEVEIELDVYWAAHAGRDPVAEIRAAAGRVRLLHMKDRTADPEPRDAPPGEGELPIADVVDAGRAVGVDWYIVEQDEPRDPIDDIRRGRQHLLALAETDPRLRRATADDVRAITSLVHDAYVGYTRLLGRTPLPMLVDYAKAVLDHEIWVLDTDGGVAGVIELVPRADHLWVENVAVAPDHQRQGLGRRLLAHAEALASSRRLPSIGLLTNERYTDNIAMYTRYGYRETHREPRSGTDLVHFRKSLDGGR